MTPWQKKTRKSHNLAIEFKMFAMNVSVCWVFFSSITTHHNFMEAYEMTFFFFGSSFFPNVFYYVYKSGGSSKFQAVTLPCPPQKSCDEHLRNSWPLVAAGLSTKLIRSDQLGWDGRSCYFLHTVSCTDSVYCDIYILIYTIYTCIRSNAEYIIPIHTNIIRYQHVWYIKHS